MHEFKIVKGVEDNDLYAPDGGVAVIRFNGEIMLTDYYRAKIDLSWDVDDIWENLAEDRMYCKEWPDEEELTKEMIDDAIDWLGFNPDECNVIEVDKL